MRRPNAPVGYPVTLWEGGNYAIPGVTDFMQREDILQMLDDTESLDEVMIETYPDSTTEN